MFCGILLALVSVDARVRDRMSDVVTGGDGITWGSRVTELARRADHRGPIQSIENAPLMVFATVGAVPVLFMVKA